MFNKPLIFIVIGMAVGTAGTIGVTKLFKPEKINYDKIREVMAEEIKKVPKTECPAAVELQSFDLSKLNNKKGNFTYAPQLHDVQIRIESKDSTLLKQLLKQSK